MERYFIVNENKSRTSNYWEKLKIAKEQVQRLEFCKHATRCTEIEWREFCLEGLGICKNCSNFEL